LLSGTPLAYTGTYVPHHWRIANRLTLNLFAFATTLSANSTAPFRFFTPGGRTFSEQIAGGAMLVSAARVHMNATLLLQIVLFFSVDAGPNSSPAVRRSW
jgi:hypothetical protein